MAKAVELLVRDEFKESAACLERGIQANKFNEALNNDMRKVLREVQERLGKLTEGAQSEAAARPLPSAGRVLSAYRDHRHDDKDPGKK